MGKKESGLQWDSMGQRVLRKGKPPCLLKLEVLAAASWADRVLCYGTRVSVAIPAALLSPGWDVGITTELTLLQTEDLIGARCWAGVASACKTSCNLISVARGVCGVQAGWVCIRPLMGYLKSCYYGLSQAMLHS